MDIFAWIFFLIPIVYSEQELDSQDTTTNYQGQLVQTLLEKYGRGYVRPVLNTSTVTKVVYRLLIYELVQMDSRNQRITISALLKQTWRDEFLMWISSSYGGISSIQLPTDVIWVPDITLHRNIDGDFERIKQTKATIYSDGQVAWFAPAIFTSSCKIFVRYFPFDIQRCQFRFGSWAYHGFEIDLHQEVGKDAEQNRFLENGVWNLKEATVGRDIITYVYCPGLPYPELAYTMVLQRRSHFYISYLIPCMLPGFLRRDNCSFNESRPSLVKLAFLENGVWDLKEATVERDIITYVCCPGLPYPELAYTLVLQRRSDFYISYLILPCMLLSGLSILVFYLPPECGEKLTLSITNLLALVVFQQLIAESMPPSGDCPPLIGDYFLAMIIMVVLSVVFTVLTINVSARSTHAVPGWIRILVLKILAHITFTYRADFDKDLSELDKSHQDELLDSLKFANMDAMSNDEPVPLNRSKVNGIAPEESSSGAHALDKMKDDLKYIRLGFESKSVEGLKISQWKHVANVIDRCLLLGFFTYAVLTSFVLIYRARGPGEVHHNSTATC